MRTFLERLQKLVEQAEVPQKSFYLLRIGALIKRLDDPRMKLAVIGNFSCGKSTFLNALLKQPFLSMANTPTTAVPTWIDWEGTQEAPQIWVKSRDHNSREMDESGRQWLFRITGTEPPMEAGPLVDYLTTTTALLDHISQVHISFPAREDLRNFILIDTPGVNPGNEADAGHILSTQNVLRDEADAAIILFPSLNAYTRAFSEFMEDNTSHLMDDSIFIITKMDIVENPEEQKELIRYVREKLKNHFELENPAVYACSAGMALESNHSSDPETAAWAEDFNRMTREIFDSLGNRRLHTAARRTSGLVLELMADLTGAVEDRQKALEGFQKNLKTYSGEAFLDYVNDLSLGYSANAALRKLLVSKADPNRNIQNAKQELRRGIQEAATWKQINGFMEKEALKIVSRGMEQVIEQSKLVLDDYENSWKKAIEDLEEALYSAMHTYQSFLDSIPGSGNQNAALRLPDTLMRVRTEMDAAIREARQKQTQLQKEAQKIAKGRWLPVCNNLASRMVISLQDHRNVCLNTVERVLDGIRESFRHYTMEAAEILSNKDTASAKMLVQLYQQSYMEEFQLKRPDLDAYRDRLEAQLEKQRLELLSLKAMEPELERWTDKSGSEE